MINMWRPQNNRWWRFVLISKSFYLVQLSSNFFFLFRNQTRENLQPSVPSLGRFRFVLSSIINWRIWGLTSCASLRVSLTQGQARLNSDFPYWGTKPGKACSHVSLVCKPGKACSQVSLVCKPGKACGQVSLVCKPGKACSQVSLVWEDLDVSFHQWLTDASGDRLVALPCEYHWGKDRLKNKGKLAARIL